MAIKRNCTYHISEDRLDRAVFIMTTIGIGNIIKEEPGTSNDGRPCWQCLTDTGVLLVMDQRKEIVITLYIATQPKVSAMYKGNTPSWVMKMVKKNRELAERQNKVGV